MAFGVRILTISSAARVPNSDRLSVYRVLGYDAVSANQEDGSARFAEGERVRSEEHTSELQSLMRISYAVFCLKKKIYNFTYYNNLIHRYLQDTPNTKK